MEIDPQAVLVLGPVPTTGQTEVFTSSVTKKKTFEIQAEKVPNAAGIRRVLAMLGGPQAGFGDLANNAKLKGGWIVGGYLSEWVGKATFPRGFKVVQDVLPNKLTETADVLLPAAMWAEKDGSWENYSGHIQPFGAAIAPPEGARREGDVYLNLLGRRDLYNAEAIRQEMGDLFATIKLETKKSAEPAFEFVEL